METLSLIWSNDLYRKLILTAIIFLLQAFVRRVLLDYAINRISDESPNLYLIRKAATYFITIVTALLIFGVWMK